MFFIKRYLVSILALTVGTAEVKKVNTLLVEVSLHAPVEGATTPGMAYTGRCADFNPRSRGGSDRNFKQF